MKFFILCALYLSMQFTGVPYGFHRERVIVLLLNMHAMYLCNGRIESAGRRGKNFNVGYISLNIRGRLLIFGIHIDHMDLCPPDL